MKRYIFHFIYFCFAWLAFTSCEQEEMNPNAGSGTLTLQLNIGNMLSRSAGDETLNENLISTLDIFLYPNNAAETDGASKYITVSPNQKNSYTVDTKLTEDEIKTLFGANATSGTCKVYVIANRPNGVDLPATTSISALKQLAVTAAFIDNTDNGSAVQTTAGSIPGRQANFVMDSDATNDNDGYDVVTLATDATNKKSLSGTVPLYRSAAKIGLFVNVEHEITDANGVTWTSDPTDMKMTFHNGVKVGYIGNDLYTYTVDYRTDDGNNVYNLFSIEEERSLAVTAPITTNGTTTDYYTSPAPYYSYPWDWSKLTNNDDTPYITLIIPWKREGTNQYLPCKYQIPVNALATNNVPTNSLQRNTYYQMLLNVGILGAFDETETVELTPSYMVVNWGSEEINTTLKENVYLVVQEHDVTINNKNEYSVEFASSHDIEVQILSITQPYYAKETAGTAIYFDEEASDNYLSTKQHTVEAAEMTDNVTIGENSEAASQDFYQNCSVSVKGNTIFLEHKVVNMGEEEEGTHDYDIAPYTIMVYVKMVYGKDANGRDLYYEDTIEYTQYPAIYVEANQNSDFGGSNGDNGDHNMMVNAYYTGQEQNTIYTRYFTQNNNSNIGYFGTAPGLWQSGNTNKNPNMYVINVTSLSDNTYTIGDSREMSIDTDLVNSTNNNNSIWATAVALYGDSPRILTSYYPTDRSRTTNTNGNSTNPNDYKTGYVIAPKFRVASSYSVTHNTNDINLAERRCASYQEDGYPAGRWRMPTYAEARFIVTLSDDGKIPLLFDKDEPYWCAHGAFEPTDDDVDLNSSNETPISIRCVYDEWYWGSERAALKDDNGKDLFTWGDYPRDEWSPTTTN